MGEFSWVILSVECLECVVTTTASVTTHRNTHRALFNTTHVFDTHQQCSACVTPGLLLAY